MGLGRTARLTCLAVLVCVHLAVIVAGMSMWRGSFTSRETEAPRTVAVQTSAGNLAGEGIGMQADRAEGLVDASRAQAQANFQEEREAADESIHDSDTGGGFSDDSLEEGSWDSSDLEGKSTGSIDEHVSLGNEARRPRPPSDGQSEKGDREATAAVPDIVLSSLRALLEDRRLPQSTCIGP